MFEAGFKLFEASSNYFKLPEKQACLVCVRACFARLEVNPCNYMCLKCSEPIPLPWMHCNRHSDFLHGCGWRLRW